MPDQTCVCIIDDDDSFRGALARLLGNLGFHIQAFSTAEAFLASEAPERSSCVISDVEMPGMSGIDLCRYWRATGRTTPVIFLTAATDSTMRIQALASGAVDYLEKPADAATVVAAIDRATSRE